MYNTTLADYIKEKKRMGYGINIIRNALYKWGYKLEDIDQTILFLYPPKTQEQTKIKKEHNLLNLFFKPNTFFNNPDNTLKKSLKYFLYSFLILFLIQTTINLFLNIFKKEALDYILASFLTNTITILLFFVSFSFFFFILLIAYFLLFKYVLKTEINFSSLLAVLLFSLLPFILVNSISNIPLYNIITILNVSIGVFNINLFLIWSLLLFSLGISANHNISLKKTLLVVFISFTLLTIIIISVFFGIIQLHILQSVFEKF